MERCRVHRDDEKLYPVKYLMWRFDLGSDDDDDVDQNRDRKPRGEHFFGFFFAYMEGHPNALWI